MENQTEKEMDHEMEYKITWGFIELMGISLHGPK